MVQSLFEVDIEGFRQTLVDDIPRILCEPISNALDTEGTEVSVEITWARGNMVYRVTDNDPLGFAELSDAWTLFAPSRRRHLAEKRGRFGYGEKEFVAVCYPGTVTIASTAGTVVFKGNARTLSKTKRSAGSAVEAQFKLSKDVAEQFISRLRLLLVPEGTRFHLVIDMGVTTDEIVPSIKPVATLTETLPTVNVDDDGNLRPTRRQARIDLIEPDEQSWIYELGMPIVATDMAYSVNVHQKVPLGRDRDNVSPSYLRLIRELVLNNTYERLGAKDAKSAWVTDALPHATPEALKAVVEAIHGPGAVIFDPSNHEANKMAAEQGRTVVHGRQFPREVWEAIRANDILKPAGRVIATSPSASAMGQPPLPEDKWTPAMKHLATYTALVSRHLIGIVCNVEFVNQRRTQTNAGTEGHYLAWWGNDTLTFNIGALGRAWAETASVETIDALIIHELAHSRASDHLSERFYTTCCELGARLRTCTANLRISK